MSQARYLEIAANGEVEEHFSAARPYRLAVLANTVGPSMTRQEFAEECDINTIMARYQTTGIWPMVPNGVEPMYYDFTSVPTDLQSAMNYMIDAEEAFMKLPAVVRREFDNDPARFVDFAAAPDNLERMRSWGLAAPEKLEEPPLKVEVVPAPAPGPAAPAAPAPAEPAKK